MNAKAEDHVLFVPVRESESGTLALRTGRLAAGPRVGLAFTSLASLRSVLGPAQPWIRLHEDAIRDLLGSAGINQIRVDARLWPPAKATAAVPPAGTPPAAAPPAAAPPAAAPPAVTRPATPGRPRPGVTPHLPVSVPLRRRATPYRCAAPRLAPGRHGPATPRPGSLGLKNTVSDSETEVLRGVRPDLRSGKLAGTMRRVVFLACRSGA